MYIVYLKTKLYMSVYVRNIEGQRNGKLLFAEILGGSS